MNLAHRGVRRLSPIWVIREQALNLDLRGNRSRLMQLFLCSMLSTYMISKWRAMIDGAIIRRAVHRGGN